MNNTIIRLLIHRCNIHRSRKMSHSYATEEQVAVAAVRRACHLTSSVFNRLVKNETLTKGDKSPVTGMNLSTTLLPPPQTMIDLFLISSFSFSQLATTQPKPLSAQSSNTHFQEIRSLARKMHRIYVPRRAGC